MSGVQKRGRIAKGTAPPIEQNSNDLSEDEVELAQTLPRFLAGMTTTLFEFQKAKHEEQATSTRTHVHSTNTRHTAHAHAHMHLQSLYSVTACLCGVFCLGCAF